MNAKTAPLDDRPLRTEPIRPTGDAGDGWGRAAAYDAYADGLHTYAIWLLRDHDAAVDALYCTFVLADRHVTQLRQPEHIQPWLYALMRRECTMRTSAVVPSDSSLEASSESVSVLESVPRSSRSGSANGSPSPVSGRLRPPGGPADPGGSLASLASLERNLRRAEFHSLEWPESEGLAPAHREILELTIRHGLDSQGLGLVLGLGQSGRSGRGGDLGGVAGGFVGGALGAVGSQGFGVLADAWRELERSLAAVAVAKASREHCAQLAELTFGWSGRLTATLRAPLTDHVDGCTRCQHYLHTVIGTPAAPTILPFVAAPRALREILLGELHDPHVALRLGIDHEAIAARIQRFTANGFPTIVEDAPMRRRGGRRAAPKGSAVAAKRKSTAAKGAAEAVAVAGTATPAAGTASQDVVTTSQNAVADGAATERLGAMDAESVRGPQVARGAEGTRGDGMHGEGAENGLPRRTPGASMRRADAGADGRINPRVDEDTDAAGVYRAPGSWAARVLPADTAMVWRPTSSDNFISTPSGRFASRVPNEVPNGSHLNGRAASVGANGTAATARMPRVGASESRSAEQQSTERQSSGARQASPLGAGPMAERQSAERRSGVRSSAVRRNARPVRRAVLSAVTLGAVGAAAAAAAALLGAATNSHSPQLADIAPPQDPVNTPMPNDRLAVSVSTPPAAGAATGVHGSNGPGTGGPGGSALGVGTSGVSGSVSQTAGPGSSGGGTSSGPGANAADLRVSVNQRDADPNSVTILLRNIGSGPIAWSATARDPWIGLSQRSGTLAAGGSQTIIATVTNGAPSGAWTSTVTFAPSGAVVTLRGGSGPSGGPSSQPSATPPTTVPPSGSPSSSPSGGSSSSSSPGSTPSSTPSASASSSAVGPSTAGASRTASASVSPSATASASAPSTASPSPSASAPPTNRPGGN